MNDQALQIELRKLDFLEGLWTNTGTVAAGAFGPGGPVSGITVYRWEIGNAWLVYKSTLKLPGLGKYEVSGGVSYDSRRSRYIAYAANSMGNLLIYDGSWESDSSLVFLQVFPEPGGLARIRYQKIDDRTIRMLSDRKTETGEFETYFETNMEPREPGE